MQTAKRRRTTWAIATSVIAHLTVAIVLLLQRPMLVIPQGESGPPEAIIPILIVPKTPPPAAGRSTRPAPIRLHRRPQPFLPPEAPTAPIAPPTPPTPAAAPAPAPGPPTFHPSPLPEGPKGDLRTALRHGTVGCANPQAVGLTRAERELCDEKFGKGAKDAAFAGLGLSPTSSGCSTPPALARKPTVGSIVRSTPPDREHRAPGGHRRGDGRGDRRRPAGRKGAVLTSPKTKRPGIAPGPLGTLTDWSSLGLDLLGLRLGGDDVGKRLHGPFAAGRQRLVALGGDTLQVAQVRAGARRDQAANDHVLLQPFQGIDLPWTEASVSTRVVSWKEAAEMKLRVCRDALVIPSSTGWTIAGRPPRASVFRSPRRLRSCRGGRP